MIYHAAVVLTRCWTERGVIKQKDAEIYRYGLELLISSFVNTILMVDISVFIGQPLIVIPYLMGFTPFRLFSGGYHARNHLTCIVVNTTLYSISCFITKHVVKKIAIPASLFVCSISFLLVLLFAPVSAANKPLCSQDKQRNHKISFFMAITLEFVCIVLFLTNRLGTMFSNMLFCGQMMATALFVAGIVVDRSIKSN